MSILVMIPAFREEENIARVVWDVWRVLPSATVLVIDDGSPDQTSQMAKEAGAMVVTLPYNLGIGGAVQMGLKLAVMEEHDYIVRLDGDGQHPPEEIPLLLKPVMDGEVNVAFGSRFCPGATPPKVILPRRIGIKMFCFLTSLFSGHKITDPTSGFMVMDYKAASFLASNLAQDYPEVDARVLLARVGLKAKEFPVQMRERQGGVSSINSISAIYYVVKVTLSVLAARSRKLSQEYSSGQFSRRTGSYLLSKQEIELPKSLSISNEGLSGVSRGR